MAFVEHHVVDKSLVARLDLGGVADHVVLAGQAGQLHHGAPVQGVLNNKQKVVNTSQDYLDLIGLVARVLGFFAFSK